MLVRMGGLAGRMRKTGAKVFLTIAFSALTATRSCLLSSKRMRAKDCDQSKKLGENDTQTLYSLYIPLTISRRCLRRNQAKTLQNNAKYYIL